MSLLLKLLYGVIIFLYLFACFSVIYHLHAYSLHKKVTVVTILMFVVGAVMLLSINLSFAFQVDWSSLGSFDFGGKDVPTYIY